MKRIIIAVALVLAVIITASAQAEIPAQGIYEARIGTTARYSTFTRELDSYWMYLRIGVNYDSDFLCVSVDGNEDGIFQDEEFFYYRPRAVKFNGGEMLMGGYNEDSIVIWFDTETSQYFFGYGDPDGESFRLVVDFIGDFSE